jgi:hypothetical protein
MALFLKEVFPCARFVVNYRSDFEAQLQSWNEAGFDPYDSLPHVNDRLFYLADLLGSDYAYKVDMTEWSKDIGVLNQLVYWMGFRECEFEEVLRVNTHDAFRTQVPLKESCRLLV